MYDELKANVFPKLPGRIVQMSVFVREMKQPQSLVPRAIFFSISIVTRRVILPGFDFPTYTYKMNWNCQKGMYAKHSRRLSVHLSANSHVNLWETDRHPTYMSFASIHFEWLLLFCT